MMHGEKANAQAAGGANVSLAVGVTESARLRGTYDAVCVGPMEHERAAYVATRDALMAAEARVAALRAVARREMVTARRVGTLRRVVTAIAVAIGAVAAATPVMARVQADLSAARSEVSAKRAELGRFVLEKKWEELAFPNLVTTVGANFALDTVLAGSSYSVVGPYLGLINTNASAAAIGDTMASHAGWLEVGNANAPAYTSPRKTVAFSSASGKSKAASSASAFAITSGGTVGGCFLVTNTGAVSTIDNTSGTLYSAGAFTGGSKVVANGDTLNVTYTASM